MSSIRTIVGRSAVAAACAASAVVVAGTPATAATYLDGSLFIGPTPDAMRS